MQPASGADINILFCRNPILSYVLTITILVSTMISITTISTIIIIRITTTLNLSHQPIGLFLLRHHRSGQQPKLPAAKRQWSWGRVS